MGTVNSILVRVENGINACLEEASLKFSLLRAVT